MARMTISALLLGFVYFSLLSTVKCSLVSALYVFGDSLFDTGNNNFLPTIGKADFLPYGVNFAKGPTGRFTNGRNIADFLAEYLELPYPPPFLSLRKTDVVVTGLNFASGTCGILTETGSLYVINPDTLITTVDIASPAFYFQGKCLNLDDQVRLFKTITVNDLAKHFNESDSFSTHLSKSIFAFSIGNNDYINNYLNTILFRTSTIYTPQQFSKLLVRKLSQNLEMLYDLGARKFVVFELGPIGCIPSIARKTQHDGLCDEEPNKLVSYFNTDLQEMLKNMTSTLRGSMFVLGQIHWLGYDVIINPSKYGLLDSSNSCCNAFFNGTSACIPLLPPCRNVDQHFFWDGYHQTEPVYSLIASRCVSDTSVCTPMNMKDLVAM